MEKRFLVICHSRHDMEVCSINDFGTYEEAVAFMKKDLESTKSETEDVCDIWCHDGVAVLKAERNDDDPFGCNYEWKWEIKEIGKDKEPDDCKIVATINWRIADIKSALSNANIEPSDENVQKLINSERFAETLKDVEVSTGWDILSDLITNVF